MAVPRLARILLTISLIGFLISGLALATEDVSSPTADAYSGGTDLELYSPRSHNTALSKRGFEFFDGISWVTANLGVTFASLSAACFYAIAASGPVGGTGCLLGAIGLMMTAATIGQKVQTQRGGHRGVHSLTIDGTTSDGQLNFRDHIGRHGLSGGFIKPSNKDEVDWDAHHNVEYLRAFNSTVKHHGWIVANDSVHGHLVPEGFKAWPIYEFRDPLGNRVHHVEFYNGHGRYHRGRMWWPDAGEEIDSGPNNPKANEIQDKKHKKVPFDNKVHFKHGGLDSRVHEEDIAGHTNRKDYKHFKEIIDCYANKRKLKKYHGLWAQTYYAKLMGTLSCTAIAAVSKEGRSAINEMKKCPVPIKTTHKCGKRYKTSG